MINYRKGITPVIAIVLLLLITVGAVGIVYTQFQGIVEGNDAEQELQQQQRIQQSSYSIVAVTATGSPGNYEVTIKNTGDDTLDLSTLGTLKIGKDGNSPQAVSAQGGSCSMTSLSPGSTVSCDSGISWGTANDGQSTVIELQVGDTVKDSFSCFENGNAACG